MPATCCGSKITSKKSDVPVFEMEKIIAYTAKNKRPTDGYRPFKIVDLEVRIFHRLTGNTGNILLAWSVPGGEKVGGYELKLFQNREDAIENFDTKGEALNSMFIRGKKESYKINAYLLQMQDLENGTSYYAAIRSWNEFNKRSEISNIAEFFLPKDLDTTTASTTEASSTTEDIGDKGGKPGQSPGNKTTEIAVGVVAGIVVLCVLGFLAYYFFVLKRKRIQEAGEGQQTELTSGPSVRYRRMN